MYDLERLERAGLLVFRNYLGLLWAFLGLPAPTRTQCEIADFLQYGPEKLMIEAFRGVGKSYIADAFVTHGWLLDPQLCHVVVSATQDYANESAHFITQLVENFELIQYLKPTPKQRQSTLAYDVALHKTEKSPSLKSVGVMGQVTGSRADIILVDDVEIPKNSFTHQLREKLANQIKELGGAVLKPDTATRKSRIIYLGTPQTEQSIYSKLPERGYEVRIWPSEVPSKVSVYFGRLAPSIQQMVDDGVKPGTPTDPARFDVFDLEARKAEYGRMGYALQFLLDTTPSDIEKHPLKLLNLIVADLDPAVAHVKYVWGREVNNRSTCIEELQAAGFEGDRYYKPVFTSTEMTPYTGSVMYVDPSGRGRDETSYAVVKHLYGQLFLMEVGGYKDGYAVETLSGLAMVALKHKVNHVICEDNFGDGMFTALLTPVVLKHHKCAVEEVHSVGQKELRIIDALEPVTKSHRLIVDRSVIEADVKVGEQDSPMYSCFYQFTHITRDKGSLPHEDRLEAVAGAVRYWVESMARDVDKAHEEHIDQIREDEHKAFLNDIFNTFQRPEDENPDDLWVQV